MAPPGGCRVDFKCAQRWSGPEGTTRKPEPQALMGQLNTRQWTGHSCGVGAEGWDEDHSETGGYESRARLGVRAVCTFVSLLIGCVKLEKLQNIATFFHFFFPRSMVLPLAFSQVVMRIDQRNGQKVLSTESDV